jgi:hypothetical protein
MGEAEATARRGERVKVLGSGKIPRELCNLKDGEAWKPESV